MTSLPIAPAPVRHGRATCGDPGRGEALEWLVTNGLGGFASGSVAGPRTRRYHGLLVAALTPPASRTVMATDVFESACLPQGRIALHAARWRDDVVSPRGFEHLEAFWLEGTVPVWRYAVGDAALEKRVFMIPGRNVTVVRYRLTRATDPVRFDVKVLATSRDFHATTRAGDRHLRVDEIPGGVRVTPEEGGTPLHVLGNGFEFAAAHTWYEGFLLSQERERGLDFLDDALHVATATAVLSHGSVVDLILSAEDNPPAVEAAARQVAARDEDLIARFRRHAGPAADPVGLRLALAADQFVVRRDVDGVAGSTVVAGYHWFGDWGRDTMIALPGLTLTTGRPDVARSILTTFAKFVDGGMLPNRFHDADGPPEYNTVDATLWYIEAIRAYVEDTHDVSLVGELWPVMEEIVAAHERGTRHGIGVDHTDGLLRSGSPGVQLTWMDAKVDEWVVTPRHGKCVEINALWYNALVALGNLAACQGHDSGPWLERAGRVRASYQRFWCADAGHLYDVIDSPDGDDRSLRPNQIFAVSLPGSPLDVEQQQAVVTACGQALLTSHGLRSLGTGHVDYHPAYVGGPRERDGAYHQGTAWSWLLGPFALAHHRVYRDARQARTFLEPLIDHLADHGLGSIAEIFDGAAPHRSRGCVAQAWSVAETLRAWVALRGAELES